MFRTVKPFFLREFNEEMENRYNDCKDACNCLRLPTLIGSVVNLVSCNCPGKLVWFSNHLYKVRSSSHTIYMAIYVLTKRAT